MTEQIRGEIIQIRRGPEDRTHIVISCEHEQIKQLKGNALFMPVTVVIDGPDTQPSPL